MVAQIDRDYVDAASRASVLRRAASYLFFEGRPATTRGQWFNSVVRANFALAERLPVRPVDRPIFVLGVGRSGTTHLGKLLSAHPDVAWLNEPKLLWSRVIPDEDVSGFYSQTGRFHIDPVEVSNEMRDQAFHYLGHYLRTVRASRVVDKYPEMTYRVSFLKAMFPDARFIAIVRQPESFARSVVSWNKAHATPGQDWWGVDRRKWKHFVAQIVPQHPDLAEAVALAGDGIQEIEMAAAEWVAGMRALVASRADIHHFTRLEVLSTAPVATMDEVLRAAELAPSPRMRILAEASTSARLRPSDADLGAMSEAVADTWAAVARVIDERS